MTDASTSIRRRVWALAWRLALPWVVCGGLLWALVALTPDPNRQPFLDHASRSTGLAVKAATQGVPDWHPVLIVAEWNSRARSEWPAPIGEPPTSEPSYGGWESGAIGWVWGSAPSGTYLVGLVSVWWLPPFPLLWSGVNLWRWVRRGSEG
ncbi:hypothetical protein [Alienimonas sp. DA493]|uniref:hypothetical protein n=1 Tax=Alienimonas sp. DA493 TaxID=3373605 RepID=UPI0037552816